jgi:DNA-binding NtrC family response regulator
VQGTRILVVEEEYLIAADIEQTLVAAGAAHVGLYREIADLIDIPAVAERFDLAVLEARLGNAETVAYAAHLRRLGVAVVVTSADSAVAALFEGAVNLGKPFDTASLIAACETALAQVAPLPPGLR